MKQFAEDALIEAIENEDIQAIAAIWKRMQELGLTIEVIDERERENA